MERVKSFQTSKVSYKWNHTAKRIDFKYLLHDFFQSGFMRRDMQVEQNRKQLLVKLVFYQILRRPLILDETKLVMNILRYIMMFKEKAEMFMKHEYPDCYTILPVKSTNGKRSNVKGKQSRRKRSEQTNGSEKDMKNMRPANTRNKSGERSATSGPDFEMILERVFPGLVDADCKFKIKIKHVPQNHFKCDGKDVFLQNNDYIDKECILR